MEDPDVLLYSDLSKKTDPTFSPESIPTSPKTSETLGTKTPTFYTLKDLLVLDTPKSPNLTPTVMKTLELPSSTL